MNLRVATLVMSGLLVGVQISVLSSLRFGNAVIMIIWLWMVALGLTHSALNVTLNALVVGLAFDARSATPFGLATLVALVIGLGVERLAREGIGDVDASAWWMVPLVGGLVGMLAPVLFAVVGTIFLHPQLWHTNIVATMGWNVVAGFVLTYPLTRIAQRTADGSKR